HSPPANPLHLRQYRVTTLSHYYTYAPILLTLVFNDTATTEIYTLPLHDALPISLLEHPEQLAMAISGRLSWEAVVEETLRWDARDRKSTRLNSSHVSISYAVLCLKKKNITFFGWLIN